MILPLLIMVFAGLPGEVREERTQRTTIDSLNSAARVMQRQADSLYEQWDTLWRRSDSLRIESMLIRMESNRLKRSAAEMEQKAKALQQTAESDTTDDETTSRETSLVQSAEMARSGALKRGQTEADSGTAWVMEEIDEEGVASYYAEEFHGRKTSSGEKYNMKDLTCAHRWLPYGTLVEVTNLDNNKVVLVRVNDRGPFKHGRIIDVSKSAAIKLDMIRAGTARVRLRVINETDQ
jgi:rare lipoprotein A